MKKRLLILMMFLVAIATGSWAEVVSYNLWVAGTQVNSSNATDVLGDGTVSYDASNGTLTLNNASITTACDEFIRSGYWGTRTGIRANQDLTIVLTGSNTIDLSALTYNRVMRHSIFVNGNLTIKGTGSLVARSGAATNNNSSDYRESTAIHAEGTLTFDGDVTVEAVGGTSECDSAGLRGVSGGVVVKGNASVVSEGSAVTVKSRTSLGAWCNVTVQGGSFVGFGKISACGTLTVPTGYYIYAGDDEASATLQSGTSYSGGNAKYVKATGTAVHTHTAGSPVQENMVGPSCTTDGQYDVVEYCTICGEEMSRETQYIPALGHDLTHVPEVPATTTAEGMKEHYTCSRCTDLLDKNYATVSASDLVIPMLVEPEAYAALSDGNKTLTFYYDGQKTARNGMSVGPFTDYSGRGWKWYEGITTVVFDASFANYKPTSTAYWFYYLPYLTTITGIENLKTDEVTEMQYMFASCSGLTSLDLSGFNTEKVTDMKSMFYECLSLTSLDVSSFNTANVTNMDRMFGYCTNLTSLDLSSFNTEKVTNMTEMFLCCRVLESLDLSSFNTENVESMFEMFFECSSLTSLDLSSFNTANVTSMSAMIYRCTALTKITVDPDKWDTSKVTYSEEMFKGCTSLVGGNGTVYDSNYTDVAYAVIDKDGTPGYLTDVNAPVEPEAYAVLSGDGKTLTFYYDMEKASRGGMSVGPFDGNTTLPAWSDKASGIRNANIDESFAGYTALTSTAYWFEGCSEIKAVSGLENLVMDNVTDMSSMFKGCNNLRSVSLSGMNTGKVTNMHGLFWDCNALQTIDLSTLDTRSVTDMSGMFNYCSGLKTVNLSGVNTASVTDMNNMFYYCSSLTDLDLSSFNTASVTNMRYMFEGCSSLTKITVSETGWTTKAVNSGTAMFSGCRDIVGGNGTTYDAGHTDEGYARIDKAGTPGYLTSSAGTGINLLKTTPGGDGYFYTPNGRRIEGQPTKQGFYITNGRKVMAK